MTEPTVTIREVFELPEDGEPDPQPDRWQVIQDRLAQEAKDVKLPARMHDLGPKICELFNVPLPNILVTSWKKVGNLQAMLERSRNAPDEIMYLELAEHSIKCEQKPYIEMKIKDLPVNKIEFLVKLLFKLKGFVLKIQNGTILQMQTGACEVQGTISYSDQVIVEKKLSPINLPGKIELAALAGVPEESPIAEAEAA